MSELTNEQIMCLAIIGNVTNNWELAVFDNFEEPDSDMLIKAVPEEKLMRVNASKLNFNYVWSMIAAEDFAVGLLHQGQHRLEAVKETGLDFSGRLNAAKKFMSKFMKMAELGRKVKYDPPAEIQAASEEPVTPPAAEPDCVEPIPQDVVVYFEAVCKAIRETAGEPVPHIYPSSNLRNDLGLDSLDITELAMSLEENFISEKNPDANGIDDDESTRWRTVQDIMDFLHEQFNETK